MTMVRERRPSIVLYSVSISISYLYIDIKHKHRMSRPGIILFAGYASMKIRRDICLCSSGALMCYIFTSIFISTHIVWHHLRGIHMSQRSYHQSMLQYHQSMNSPRTWFNRPLIGGIFIFIFLMRKDQLFFRRWRSPAFQEEVHKDSRFLIPIRDGICWNACSLSVDLVHLEKVWPSDSSMQRSGLWRTWTLRMSLSW